MIGEEKRSVAIIGRSSHKVTGLYNSGSAPARVLQQLLLKGINDECYSKDITFPPNKYR